MRSVLEEYLDSPGGVRELKKRNCNHTPLPKVRTAGKYAVRRPPQALMRNQG
jgi:hypothetical protein